MSADTTTYTLASDFGADRKEHLRYLVSLAARVRPLPVKPGEALLIGVGPYGPASSWLMGRGNLPSLTAERLVEYRHRFRVDVFAVIAFDAQSQRCLLGAGAGLPDVAIITAAAIGVIGTKDQKPASTPIVFGDATWFVPLDPSTLRPDDLLHHAGATLFSYGRAYAREHLMRRATARQKSPAIPAKFTITA